MRRPLAPHLLLLVPVLVGAHPYPFPLPIPPEVRWNQDSRLRRFQPPSLREPEVMRTRVVEGAVSAAGGWSRWRQVQGLFLRSHRRRFDALGQVVFHDEVSDILGQERFYRYWKQAGVLHVATLDGDAFRVVQPDLHPGHPRLDEIRREMDKELFWRAHPWVLYRPGVTTRYVGTTYTRGVESHGLLVHFAPGASPYREVRYLFDPLRGDLLKATAVPALEGEPTEEIHFSGRVESTGGLRIPRRRELLIDGIVREVVTTLEVATRAPWLPPGGFSSEARERRRRGLLARR